MRLLLRVLWRLYLGLGFLMFTAILLDNGLYYLTEQPEDRDHIYFSAATGEIVLERGQMGLPLLKKLREGSPLRIMYTNGGRYTVMEALLEYDVIIDGGCGSACVWLLTTSDRACFTENARFGFHAWHSSWVRIPFRSDQLRNLVTVTHRNVTLTDQFIAQVKEPIRSKIKHRRNTSDTIMVPLADFMQTYPEKVCANN